MAYSETESSVSLSCESSDLEEIYESCAFVLPYQFEPDHDDPDTAEETDGDLGLARLFTTDWYVVDDYVL